MYTPWLVRAGATNPNRCHRPHHILHERWLALQVKRRHWGIPQAPSLQPGTSRSGSWGHCPQTTPWCPRTTRWDERGVRMPPPRGPPPLRGGGSHSQVAEGTALGLWQAHRLKSRCLTSPPNAVLQGGVPSGAGAHPTARVRRSTTPVVVWRAPPRSGRDRRRPPPRWATAPRLSRACPCFTYEDDDHPPRRSRRRPCKAAVAVEDDVSPHGSPRQRASDRAQRIALTRPSENSRRHTICHRRRKNATATENEGRQRARETRPEKTTTRANRGGEHDEDLDNERNKAP